MKDAEIKALITRIGAGDKTAMAALYNEMQRPLFNFINMKLNDSFQSSDILQDVFMDVWKAAAGFEGRSTAKTWMFSIAYRKVMDVFRKNARLVVTDDMPELVDDSPDVVSCIAAAQQSEHLKFCLEGLKPEHRSAV